MAHKANKRPRFPDFSPGKFYGLAFTDPSPKETGDQGP